MKLMHALRKYLSLFHDRSHREGSVKIAVEAYFNTNDTESADRVLAALEEILADLDPNVLEHPWW